MMVVARYYWHSAIKSIKGVAFDSKRGGNGKNHYSAYISCPSFSIVQYHPFIEK